MTCLEAQSNIMGFIDKKLPDDKVADFVRHIKHCPNCSEELEIYYTLIVGMREVDSGKEMSFNFKKDLEDELNRIDNKVKKVQRFKISTFGISFVTLVVFMIIFYARCLDKVYNIEQNRIKEKQGKHYFLDNFSEYISLEEDIVKNAYIVPEVEEESKYEIIHIYNITHVTEELENEGN